MDIEPLNDKVQRTTAHVASGTVGVGWHPLVNQVQPPLEDIALLLFQYICPRAQSPAKSPLTNKGTSAETLPEKRHSR